MTDKPEQTRRAPENIHREYEDNVRAQERRRLRALRQGDRSVFFGLGMFGLVGWSVAVPTLMCTALGVYLDMKLTSSYSWTLMLLFIGIVAGCWNAWFWISKERRDIESQHQEDTHDHRE